MILSVSRRTDIPAFFPDWFYERIRAGEVYVRNPMNVHSVSRIDISPKVTDCIVFWSKNPKPMLPRLNELSAYDYYFQFTLNAYERDIEPKLPALEERIETFRELSGKIGSERVIWRYDPIILTKKYPPQWHIGAFRHIARELSGMTEKCVISFVDIYPSKNAKTMSALDLTELSDSGLGELAGELAEIGAEYGIRLTSCAERIDLERFGIEHGSCIDKALIERITGCTIKAKPDGQREYCRCLKCEDIGCYDTCPHGCIYCYANYRPAVTAEKYAVYDKSSPILCDSIDWGSDRITDRPVKSFKTLSTSGGYDQLSLY